MSKNILLSFIIPVYNVEKYLNECLDSIFDPSVSEDDYEVIAVDDGSTDRSPEILTSYLHHRNFRIITQENSGPGGARNAGMKGAKGKYIHFTDGDDALLPGTIPALLDYVSEADFDVIEFLGQTMDEKGRYIGDFQQTLDRILRIGSGKDVLAAWYEKNALSPVVWIRVFRRRFLIENSLYFREHIFQEDVEWIYRCFFYAKTVTFYPQTIYSYRRRPNSATTEKNDIKRCLDYIAVADLLIEFRNSLERNEENMKYISVLGDKAYCLLESAINIFCKSSSLREHRQAIFIELEKRRSLLSLATGRRGWFLYRLTRFMPTIVAFRIYKAL